MNLGIFRLANPFTRRPLVRQIRRAGEIADWLHNLAFYSAHDFERFDEDWFWRDLDRLNERHPDFQLLEYRRIFEQVLTGEASGGAVRRQAASSESDRLMRTHLVGLIYHEPEWLALWNRGVIEDYESTTGVFIEAESEEQALKWGGTIADALLRYVTGDPSLSGAQFGYGCWIVPDPRESCWSHCLGFYQHVRCGQMPDLERMTSAAYGEWKSKRTWNGFRYISG